MNAPFVALAVSTTGSDPRRDRICAISAVSIGDGQAIEWVIDAVSQLEQLGVAQAGLRLESRRTPWPEAARELRDLTTGRRIVVHDAERALAVLAAEGVRFSQPAIDTAELASILVLGLASTDLGDLCRALSDGDHGSAALETRAGVVARVFSALKARIAEYDDVTLERLALHVSEGGWPFADLFRPEVAAGQRQKTRSRRHLPPEVAFTRERPREEPLEATGSLQAIERRAVVKIIGPQGSLAEVIPGFERREQQEQMAEAVAGAINESGQMVVEAGTGTGKSLAYLVPSALAAAERGELVVLSTNTLALQDQLLRKDVPDLVAALEKSECAADIEVVALKGRANYLCLRRWFPWERQQSLEQGEARLKAKVLAWLPLTATGDRAELRLSGSEEVYWRQIAEDEGVCDPSACMFHQRGQCFLFRARRAAAGAHLVVVNHALLLTDAASSNRILPDYDTLIIDEAHHLEDQATSQFTVTLRERDLDELANAIAASDGPVLAGVAAGAVAFLLGATEDEAGHNRAREGRARLDTALLAAETMRKSARDLFAALEFVHAEAGTGATGLERTRRVTTATRASPAWEQVDAAWDRLLETLREAETALRWLAAAVEGVDDVASADLAEAGERHELLMSDLASTLRAGTETAVKYAAALDAPESGRVYWLEQNPSAERIMFRSAPLDVSQLLQDRLFKRTRTTVLTSATMAIDGSCDYIARRLGIPDATSLIVPSPFDYRRSALLYLADDMPEPTHPVYQEALEATLIATLGATKGRALVLFTSHSLLAAVAHAITKPLHEQGITVLAQRRDGSPQQLTERLRREPNVAVLGTATFWEGVDVAGEALSLLVIARLPFSVPSDPVFAARSEAFEDAFNGYAVPQAVLRFKQGFGRLIRSSRDRGVCAVLDRRILTKRYGATFVQSLPECTVAVGSAVDLPSAARRWLDRTREGSVEREQPMERERR